jgi:hypothetical protein
MSSSSSIADVTLGRSLRSQIGVARGRSSILWIFIGIIAVVLLFVFLGRFARGGGGGGDITKLCVTDGDCGQNSKCITIPGGARQCFPLKACKDCNHNTEVCFQNNCIPRSVWAPRDVFGCNNDGSCVANPTNFAGDYTSLEDCNAFTNSCIGGRTMPSGWYIFSQFSGNAPGNDLGLYWESSFNTYTPLKTNANVSNPIWYYDNENQAILILYGSLWLTWTYYVDPLFSDNNIVMLMPACNCNAYTDRFLNDGCPYGQTSTCPIVNYDPDFSASRRVGFQLFRNGIIGWRGQYILTRTVLKRGGDLGFQFVPGNPSTSQPNIYNAWVFSKQGTPNTETFPIWDPVNGCAVDRVRYTNNRCILARPCTAGQCPPAGYECRPTPWNNPPTAFEQANIGSGMCVPIDAAPPLRWTCSPQNAIGCVPAYNANAPFNTLADCNGSQKSATDPARCLSKTVGRFGIITGDRGQFLTFAAAGTTAGARVMTVEKYGASGFTTVFTFQAGNILYAENSSLPAVGYPRFQQTPDYGIFLDAQGPPAGRWFIVAHPLNAADGSQASIGWLPRLIYYQSNDPNVVSGYLGVGLEAAPRAQIVPEQNLGLVNWDQINFYLFPVA